MTDRQPTYPGRVTLTPVDGQQNTYDMVMADEPTELGDPPVKVNLLKDSTADLYEDLPDDPVVDDVFADIAPGLRPGSIVWHASQTVPLGFLLCDGSAVSREDYRRLFEKIGTVFGVGDGSTTFNIPDLRAAFVRGFGTSNGYSAGAFGSKQEATAFGRIDSGYQLYYTAKNTDKIETLAQSSGVDGNAQSSKNINYDFVRPYNITLLPIIKY